MPTVMISCGELSGDIYAGALAGELRRLRPGIRIIGLGGDRLREAGAELVGDYHGLAVTGLVEALEVLPRAWTLHRALVRRAAAERPDALVVIDFADFNFRADARLRVTPTHMCSESAAAFIREHQDKVAKAEELFQ